MSKERLVAMSLVLASGACGSSSAAPRPPERSLAAPPAGQSTAPPTPRRSTALHYQGIEVKDDYAWLENPVDPEVKAWSQAQTAYARRWLDAAADRPRVRARVAELLTSQSAAHTDIRYRGGLLFALKEEPPKQQPLLVVMKSADDPRSERVIVDPNLLDASGKTTIDFYAASRDGKRVAVSLSKGGSESGDLAVYDVDTGKPESDVLPRVNGGTAGGSVAWNADGSGFFYTRYPREGERPPSDVDFYQQVYFHKLGTATGEDTYAIGRDFPRIAETTLASSDDGKFTLARVANGDGGEFAFYVRGPEGTWSQVAAFSDKAIDAEFGRDDSLYFVSIAARRGQVLRAARASEPIAQAKVVVPESDAIVRRIALTNTHLYVLDLVGGPSQIRVFPSAGAPGTTAVVPILPVSTVSEIEPMAGDQVLLRNESYLEPPAWYRYDPKGAKTTRTALVKTTIADMHDIEVRRESCASKDGTPVPVNVLRKRGTAYDGKSIALLTGYGGYGISRSPKFRPLSRLWLDQGGVFAEANVRGGSEFGEDWHIAGKLTHKQNVFDDFYACARRLVEEGATQPERLSIMGGSNGGLLMGAELVQHPEMFRAVVSLVGIYDMLRVESTPNGAFNVTEFGSVTDPQQFRALYAYSPYHHVIDGVPYPAVLFLTGENDPRVDPYNSRKMTARLQAATSSHHPILLRTSGDTGHGIGTPLAAEIEEDTDIYVFLLRELGVSFQRVP